MARDLSAKLKSELTAASLAPIILVKLAFASGDLNLWSGLGTLLFDDDTYTGAGDLIALGVIDETETLSANAAQLSLSGVPASLISLALTEEYQGRAATIWLGALSDDGTLIVSPYQLFKGFMDVMQFRDEGDTATFILTVENELIALERASLRRYTPEDQAIDGVADTGFDQVVSLQDIQIVWGR